MIKFSWMAVMVCWVLVTVPARAAEAPVILVLGDSLSAGYGVARESSWVSLLERRLKKQGYPHRVVNASISGDTTAGGLARLPAALASSQPAIVLVELGANDGLRGQPVKQMQANLAQLLLLSRQQGAKTALFEMRIPANYGAAYTAAFNQAFFDVAKQQQAALVPFWLISIAADPKQFQDDGLHPTAAAQPKLLDAVWPTLEPLLRNKRGPLGQASKSSVLP